MMYQVSNGNTAIKDYYIVQSGGVHFPTNCAYLFYQLSNVRLFTGTSGDSIANINYVTDTSYMFAGDSNLESYGIYGSPYSFDSVVDMTGMFMDSANLDNVALGMESMPMNAPNLENANAMFALDNSLKNVSLYLNTTGNNTTSLLNLSGLFDNSTSIQNIYGINNIKYKEDANIGNMIHNNKNL